MIDDDFEWDDAKTLANLAKHGIPFDAARLVFQDSFAVDWFDGREDYGEDRYARIGMVQGRLLYVAYTMRGERIRVISIRGTEPHEHRRYHEENI
jgi:uncharacterized protein